MNGDRRFRDQVVSLLRGGNAHLTFSDAVASFPPERINDRPPNVPYTFWHLLEHLRFTQADILVYLTHADYTAPAWPDDYWPPRDAEATPRDWDESVAAFEQDLSAIIAIVADPATDLAATVPTSDEHTILRQALLVADHNAYHIGELGILRQVAAAWGDGDAP